MSNVWDRVFLAWSRTANLLLEGELSSVVLSDLGIIVGIVIPVVFVWLIMASMDI